MAKSKYFDLILGKNIAPIQKEINVNSDKIKAAQQSLKNISEGAAALHNQAKISYPTTVNPKTWKNIGLKPLADAKINALKASQVGKTTKNIENLTKAQEVAKINLRNEGLKTLGARAGTVAGLAAATAGGVYLKKKMDEKKKRDAARQSYYESLGKTAAEITADLRLSVMVTEILEGTLV